MALPNQLGLYNRLAMISWLAWASAPPALAGSDGWIEFTSETTMRLLRADGSYFGPDPAEKDFAWGDFDHDGDLDLVSVRKRESGLECAGSTMCQNVLFMQEGPAEGWTQNVFVDRTLEYATEADDGGQGFLDITNDRDVAVADVNDDGWLDIITAVANSDGLPKTISHPRIYINKGAVAGVWQGFRYEQARIPQIFTIPAGLAVAPRFCAVAAGDLTGDGMPDLYFADHDNAVTSPPMPAGHDVNDRLLINDGNGFFTDSLQTRMTAQMLSSAFAMATAIEDMNGDGVKDVVKDTALQTPQQVSISYNNPANEGFFNLFAVVVPSGDTPYHVTVGHLNDDHRLDIVVSSAGTDFYKLNTGNNAAGEANFTKTFFNGGSGFGGNSLIADLNRDGHNDVLITDHDIDFFGCSGRMNIYRNLGDNPSVTLQEQGGAAPWTPNGTHDVAVFDLSGDTWPDMIIGTCAGYQVWINEPSVQLLFTYPTGVPEFVQAEEGYVFEVIVAAFGSTTLRDDSGELHYSIDGGPYQSVQMTFLGNDTYQAMLPAVPCPMTISWSVSAELVDLGPYFDPPGGVTAPYVTIAAGGIAVTLAENFEGDVSSWTVANGPDLDTGGWEQADPNGTTQNGTMAAPEDDATAGPEAVQCFVTQNGPPGGSMGFADVDGGPTDLISPTLDLAGTDSYITYARWFYSSGGTVDSLIVEISNDGGQQWVLVENVGPTGSSWQEATFQVSDFLAPTSTVNLRFRVSDLFNDSVTEAGIDDFRVQQTQCPPEGDCNNDLVADLSDHGEFFGCLAGPGGGLGSGCACFDFDGNLAIDLHDFREMQTAIAN